MINHISIKNFAIIKNTEIDFEEGLNIITGETGSGKSIVVEAISLALGSRADSTYVRTGSDKAIIQLSGELDGEEIVIVREISQNGKNLCKLNGEIVTLSQVNQVSARLADIHGQYDNQSLLNPDYHMTLVDSYHHEYIDGFKEKVASAYFDYNKCKSSLNHLLSVEKEYQRKRDFYQYEAAEINKAALLPGEDAELEDRISLLQNSEKIFEAIKKTCSILYEETPSAMDGLQTGLRSIEEISSFSAELGEISREFGDLYYRLEDICRGLRNIEDSLTFSPAELDSAISRLDLIDSLKKKYGQSIEEITAYRDRITNELSVMENFDVNKSNLEKQISSYGAVLLEACNDLSAARKKVAEELKEKISRELHDLNFQNSEIMISITPLSVPTENGMDQIEILITTNRGEPLKPLQKIASGGEMSRIMLAFKNIISSYDKIPTLIFDEIDTGISGVTASIVGRKLKEISKHHQIICITHLPQIAACGETNYRIYKESDESSTFTSVERLSDEEKVKEMAKLLGGTVITDSTLQSARELIESSI